MHRITSKLLAAALLLGAATLLIACGSDDDDSDNATPTMQDGDVSTMHVVMQDIAYDTTTLTARQGESVRIEVNNRGALTHDFTIEHIPVDGLHMMGGSTMPGHDMDEGAGYDMHLALDQGKQGTIEFTPMESGQYEYFCTVPGHREAGMHGTLTVE